MLSFGMNPLWLICIFYCKRHKQIIVNFLINLPKCPHKANRQCSFHYEYIFENKEVIHPEGWRCHVFFKQLASTADAFKAPDSSNKLVNLIKHLSDSVKVADRANIPRCSGKWYLPLPK